MSRFRPRRLGYLTHVVISALLLVAPGATAQSLPGEVTAETKISSSVGGLVGPLDDVDGFSRSVALLGDLDADGRPELAVGALGDDDGGSGRGAVWILSLNDDGSVDAEAKISATAGGFTGVLDGPDQFGFACARLPDLDGDGIPELAVGAPKDDDGGSNRGAVWVLFLAADGSVKHHAKISATSGGLAGPLDDLDDFGTSLAFLGDLDADGHLELAVGAISDDDGQPDQGAVWILSLAPDGTVVAETKISATAGGFLGALDTGDEFGIGLAAPGDLDRDGVDDLVVGARRDDDGGPDRGAVWILFLTTDGTVKSHTKISDTSGGLTGALADEALFGASIAGLGDLDGDGEVDLAVGANHDTILGLGAVHVLFLDGAGGVRSEAKIGSGIGNFGGDLDPVDDFGIALAALGDLDGDGHADLAAGSLWDDDGGTDRGAVWILGLDAAKWLDLGQGLAGTVGPPALTGAGTLLAGEPVVLSVTDGLPGGAIYLIKGFVLGEVPFKGGVLVPGGPLVITPPLPLDGAGALLLPFSWPAGVPSDLQLVLQGWVVDAGGPHGFASTNGLLLVTP